MDKLKCKVCDYKWLARVFEPIECPNCKSRSWNDRKVKEYKDVLRDIEKDSIKEMGY